MIALVSAETVLLVLLVVLVAGLLRSHAELLRRIGPAADPAAALPASGSQLPQPPASSRRRDQAHAAPLTGLTLGGDAVALDFAGGGTSPTLLAFLSSGCSTCAGFWETLGERRLPGIQTVIVTRGADRERPASLRSLAPDGVAVVMSSSAWEDYGVPGAPYFVLVDEEIRGEGVATGWPALSCLVRDAVQDAALAGGLDPGAARARSVDEALAAGGIGPGDARLYPGRA